MSRSTSIPAASVAVRASVPVLCYHQVREWRAGESRVSRGLTTPPALFAEQMAFLAQDGWHVVSLRAYYEHVLRGTPLPSKPIVLTFDDGHESQMTAVPMLQRYHFTATFFLMTVTTMPTWPSCRPIVWRNSFRVLARCW